MTEEEASIAAAEASADADPRNAPALLHAAELCIRRGEPWRAEALARRAVALEPAAGKALRALSGFLAVQGKREEAIEVGLAAARMRPGDAETRLHVGALLAADGQWRAAAEQLAAHVGTATPSAAGWRLLSTALQQLGRTQRGLEAIDHAIALAPGSVEFRIHRASLLGVVRRYGDALRALQEAAALEPSDARIWRSLSSLHEVLEERSEALVDAERAVELDAANPEYRRHLDHARALLGLAPGGAPAGGDAGYWTRPSARARRTPPAPLGTARAAAIQGRVIFALMLREMRTRFGRSRVGYLWAILEPVSHILTLGSVFALFNHAPPPVGNNLFLFYLMGLLPFLMFSHVAMDVMSSLTASAPLLQIPLIRRIDVIVSRALLYLATELVVGIAVFTGAALLGLQGMPADLLTVMQALAALWLIALGIGALNIVAAEVLPGWETFFGAVLRLLYFASGIYYTPIALPAQVRAVLVWNPVLQCVEWFRSGFYAGYQPHWLDRGYVLLWVLGTLLAGFAAERAMRRRMMVVA